MKFTISPDLEKRSAADLLVVPFWEGGKEAAPLGSLKKKLAAVLKSGDFKGKAKDNFLLYVDGEPESRVMFLGLGKDSSDEDLRRCYAAAVRSAKRLKIKRANFLVPTVKNVRGVIEGILLTNYRFEELKGENADPEVLLESVGFVGLDKKHQKQIDELETISKGVFWCRDLVNRNADDKTPAVIAKMVETLAKSSPKLKATIMGRKEIEKEKMGLLLAVNRASSHDPYFVQLKYTGNPKSKEHIVLVGKGVTYDTGGLSLKPTEGMLTMKCDMSGAATVIAAVHTACELGLKVNVTAVTPLTENCIDANSYKIGDVYRSYSGRTVEVNNTDAEGRLILADALSYAAKNLDPTCMVDIASLTGAMVIALGENMSGLFTSDDKLGKKLMHASDATSELLWPMPLNPDYKEGLKSDIADCINTCGRDAGSIKAAFFLEPFAGKVPWAHIDFAGPCHLSKPKHYNTTHATGYGVRLFIEFLKEFE